MKISSALLTERINLRTPGLLRISRKISFLAGPIPGKTFSKTSIASVPSSILRHFLKNLSKFVAIFDK